MNAPAIKGAFSAQIPPVEPTLSELLTSYRQALNWTPENDGLSHELADTIKVRIMADLKLSKADADALGEALS